MIHVFLTVGRPLPSTRGATPTTPSLADIPALVTSYARQSDALQHVTAHHYGTDFVVTLFISSDRLTAAETTALAICRRAVTLHPALRHCSVRCADAGFVAAYHER